MGARLVGLALVVLAACSPGAAYAASFRASSVLRPADAASLRCLQSSADGTLVSWQDRRGTIRAGSWRESTQNVELVSSCPAAAVATDGSAALAADGKLALRPAGGQFTPFGPLALPEDVDTDESRVSLGGGVVAMGATRQEAERIVPLLMVRGSDGVLRSAPLPGGLGSARTADAVVGPLVALDGAGRGLVAWGGARSARGQLLAARFDGSGTLGPTQVLAEGGADVLFSEPAIAVGADGSAAVAWTAGPRTTVLTGTTATGFDLGTAASLSLNWLVSVAPDGAAVAVGSDFERRGRQAPDRHAAGQADRSRRLARTLPRERETSDPRWPSTAGTTSSPSLPSRRSEAVGWDCCGPSRVGWASASAQP